MIQEAVRQHAAGQTDEARKMADKLVELCWDTKGNETALGFMLSLARINPYVIQASLEAAAARKAALAAAGLSSLPVPGDVCWLIEKYSTEDGWSADIQFATGLANEESAMQVILHVCHGEGRAVAHPANYAKGKKS